MQSVFNLLRVSILTTTTITTTLATFLYSGGGDIPSVDEIRRSACRVQGRTFEQKIKDRDSRLKQDTTSTVASSK
jgi:hypothetical protein